MSFLFGNSGGRPHPVGQKKPNAWGPYDMEENVWELVSDWYAPYSAEPQSDPAGPAQGTRFTDANGDPAEYRVARCGSFFGVEGTVRVSTRNDVVMPVNSLNATGFPTGSYALGFRLARDKK